MKMKEEERKKEIVIETERKKKRIGEEVILCIFLNDCLQFNENHFNIHSQN